ncbi:MAG: DMT family transporter [Hyphomonadaceae bacterium]|jgi:drug/metabolite transporter (DMT)-like permease|nr:DMT family transporter [Hyphomonadaceae bacterium]
MPVDPSTRRQRHALFLGLLGVVIFSLTMPATRAAVLELDPLFITLGRALLAALLAALTLVIVRPQPPQRRDWGRLFWFSVCSIIGFPLLMTIAMQYAPASHAAVVLAVLPLLTAMAGVLVAHERPSLGFWICGVVGTLVVLIYAILSGSGAGNLHWADLLLAAAALSAATAYALGGEMSLRIGGWEVISWALVVSAPAILVLFLFLAPPINWGASASAWAGFLYVAVFSQFLGFFAWNKGMSLGGIAKIGQMQLLQPFVTLVAAYLLLGETIGWMEIVFSSVVVGLVALGWRMRVARSP